MRAASALLALTLCISLAAICQGQGDYDMCSPPARVRKVSHNCPWLWFFTPQTLLSCLLFSLGIHRFSEGSIPLNTQNVWFRGQTQVLLTVSCRGVVSLLGLLFGPMVPLRTGGTCTPEFTLAMRRIKLLL